MKKHKELIKKCAKLSNDTYNEINNYNEKLEDKYTDTIIYFILEDSTLFITGPGSESYRDWSLDFQIWRTKVEYFENTLVHAGFMKIYNSVRSRLLCLMKVLLETNEINKIVCTGHSLFGAISTIIATDLSIQFDLPVICITFGSPRVGNNEFAELFNNNVQLSYRCVFKKDPITFTPLPIRFKHVRGLLNCDFKTIKESEIPQNYDCLGCRIKHHSMEFYKGSIQS
tara:strand:+ start:11689 stop:12369 length:681 start_codon:yes stop_codon:yes gene_type:complete